MADGQPSLQSARIPNAVEFDELWLAVVHFRRQIVAIVFVVSAVVAIFSSIMPKLYQATALIRIGHVYTPSKHSSDQIEPPQALINRIEQDSFKARIMALAGLSDEHDTPYLHARVVPGTDFVRVIVRAHSWQDAEIFAKTISETILETHDRLVAPAINALTADLATEREELDSTLAQQKKLLLELSKARRSEHANLLADAFAVYVTNLLSTQTRQMRQSIANLQQRLRPPLTEKTTMEPIEVTHQPVAPRVLWNVLVSGLIAFVISVFIFTFVFRRGDAHSASVA